MVLVILPSEYQKTLQFGVNRKAFVSFSDFREYTITQVKDVHLGAKRGNFPSFWKPPVLFCVAFCGTHWHPQGEGGGLCPLPLPEDANPFARIYVYISSLQQHYFGT